MLYSICFEIFRCHSDPCDLQCDVHSNEHLGSNSYYMIVVELNKCMDVDLPEGGINASTLVLELKG